MHEFNFHGNKKIKSIIKQNYLIDDNNLKKSKVKLSTQLKNNDGNVNFEIPSVT